MYAGGAVKSMITLKDYSELTPEQISYMAEIDCGIPAVYEPWFVVTQKMIDDRIKYFEDGI